MKAAIYPGHGEPLVIAQVADPEPGAGELLIRVDRCGICGTDLAMTRGAAWDYGAGSRLGHEYAGEVVGLGRDVEGWRVGDRIAVLPSGACGHCQGCAGGNHVLCRNEPGVAHGFAELARVPAALAVRLPQVLSFADGALVEPLAVSLYGVRRSGLEPGNRVVILGGGTVALYAAYWARRLGAGRIVAVSRSARRRNLCMAMGSDRFLTSEQATPEAMTEALGGAADIVFECVGSAGLLAQAVQHAGPYGRVVSLGFCTSPDTLVPAIAAYKCVTLQFLVGYTMDEFRFIANQMDKGHVDPKTIVTATCALPDMPAAFQRLRAPHAETKVHVLMR